MTEKEESNFDKTKDALFFAFGGDKPLVIHRPLIDLLDGDILSALLLDQIIFWSDKSEKNKPWFYKSAKDWKEHTGLTEKKLTRARKKLIDRKLITTKLKRVYGAPTLHYKFDWDEFAQQVEELSKLQKLHPR